MTLLGLIQGGSEGSSVDWVQKLQFDAHGISIPFPQQDLHLHKVG